MIKLFHLAHRIAGAPGRAGRAPLVALLLMVGLAGCRHKRPGFVIPTGAQAPVPLEPSPGPEPPPMIATVPPPESPPLPSAPVPAPTPRKRPTAAPKEEVQPPVQIAEGAPAALAIGTLSTGGDPTPQSQHEAQDLITSILRRIAALPARTAEAEKKPIRQVRHFLDQAQQALNSGDAQGAQNLATKARLLMDDLEKR